MKKHVKSPSHAFEESALYLVKDAERFQATIQEISTDNPEDRAGNTLKKNDVAPETLLVSLGPDGQGVVSFKIAVGEIWRSAVIQTNITTRDHPLNMGIEKYAGTVPSRVNLRRPHFPNR
ncbi:MAG TPA: hypothetical protein PLK85_01680 [Alphaproteobacteria bacterium]|nr:hypothetical protein [Alphaproteobacteria bacterium]